ncbi:defensin-like protein 1 [Rutidosis leptorrhynchoides]|uniref:defensin-like protein 1 n=1 Tax=Rutidosis leptorrhynchoides TaxID=125765 RepID=UPI003A993D40
MKKTIINGFFLILILLLVPYKEIGEKVRLVAEGRTCESQSHGFKGRCISEHNCGLVCKNEGFQGGICRGVRGRCFCTKQC